MDNGKSMSADFVSAVLEIDKGRNPDWEAARAHVRRLSEHELATILNNDYDLSEDADYEGHSFIEEIKNMARIKSLESYFIDTVDTCESMWHGNSFGSRYELSRSKILVCGEEIEESEGYREIIRFKLCGAAKAAGFITT